MAISLYNKLERITGTKYNTAERSLSSNFMIMLPNCRPQIDQKTIEIRRQIPAASLHVVGKRGKTGSAELYGWRRYPPHNPMRTSLDPGTWRVFLFSDFTSVFSI